MSGTVYLCGQITGATYDEARFGWRQVVGRELGYDSIRVLSPMRRINPRRSDTSSISPHGLEGDVLQCARGLTACDRFDLRRSDLVFANLVMNDQKKISVGSMIELGWADAYGIPVVAVLPEGNAHDHGMVRELITWRCQTVEQAIEVTRAVLSEGL